VNRRGFLAALCALPAARAGAPPARPWRGHPPTATAVAPADAWPVEYVASPRPGGFASFRFRDFAGDFGPLTLYRSDGVTWERVDG